MTSPTPARGPITCIPCKKEWLPAVALLHQQGITTGFLSRLGAPFLAALYGAIASSRWSRVFVALSDQQPVGFVACSIDTGRMYGNIILTKGLLFAALLLPNVLRISVLRNICETILYPVTHRAKEPPANPASAQMSNREPPKAELLSVAVDKQWQGRGVGKLLVAEMGRYFAERGVTRCKVVTLAKDETSNGFYRAAGFEFAGTFVHHGNEMCEYIKAIQPK
jgi:ribosomal protein S18 acetylase RimI-like enzyme